MLEKRYRLLWEFAKGLHKTQAKALVAISRSLIECGQMRSFALAGALARATGIRFKSGLQRFYRWVHNPALDDLMCWSALAGPVLTHAGKRPLIAVDWTEWHSNLRVLSAAVCVGSRAIPVLVQAFPKADMPRSQNTRENTFIQLLARLSERMSGAVLVFDRGFRRVSLISELKALRQPFIIRLAAKVHACAKSYSGLLREHPLQPGQRVDLGICRLNARAPVSVRVIGVWAMGQDEPWWLATTLICSHRRVAVYYDRRMGIEESFRDSKGCRFGIKMKWTAFKNPESVGRLFLLAAIASTVWFLAAVLACRGDPGLALPSKSKGNRRSLISIGLDSPRAIASVLVLPMAALAGLWPKVALRRFEW